MGVGRNTPGRSLARGIVTQITLPDKEFAWAVFFGILTLKPLLHCMEKGRKQ
jgi:hypothetical protein